MGSTRVEANRSSETHELNVHIQHYHGFGGLWLFFIRILRGHHVLDKLGSSQEYKKRRGEPPITHTCIALSINIENWFLSMKLYVHSWWVSAQNISIIICTLNWNFFIQVLCTYFIFISIEGCLIISIFLRHCSRCPPFLKTWNMFCSIINCWTNSTPFSSKEELIC